jgi:hypothetical protein
LQLQRLQTVWVPALARNRHRGAIWRAGGYSSGTNQAACLRAASAQLGTFNGAAPPPQRAKQRDDREQQETASADAAIRGS